MIKEFKAFIARGNVLDLAVGIVIGAAFGKIVSSFVEDMLMPPIGLVLGNVDFSNLYVSLNGATFASLAEAKKAGAPTLNYGNFANSIINFLIIAFAVFLVVKAASRFKPAEAAAPSAPTQKNCPFCLSTIALAATRCPHCTSQLSA